MFVCDVWHWTWDMYGQKGPCTISNENISWYYEAHLSYWIKRQTWLEYEVDQKNDIKWTNIEMNLDNTGLQLDIRNSGLNGFTKYEYSIKMNESFYFDHVDGSLVA